MAFAWQGKFQEAKGLARKAANLDPTYFFPPFMEGWMEIQAGSVKDAIPLFQKAIALGSPPFVAAWLGYAYGVTGDRARAMAALDELKKTSLKGYIPPFNLAIVHLGLGDRARALDYLEQAYDNNSQWMPYLRGDRIWDPLRSEPRFAALMRKLGFEK
jgi:tetratricopeptide (TPR) repeat protein